jgi:hypothetical protein
MTFDNAGYLFDGTSPPPPLPPPVVVVNIMPSVAIQALQQVGIFVPTSLGYFGTFPISVQWAASPLAPGIVLAQVPQPGTFIPANGAVMLTASEFPMSVAFP